MRVPSTLYLLLTTLSPAVGWNFERRLDNSTSSPTSMVAAQASATLSVPTSSPTISSNATSSHTPSVTGTCCYLQPIGVGINTWYSKSYDLTVATVVTNWVQYPNGSLAIANSTTSTVSNATSFYGSYGYGLATPVPTAIPTDLLPPLASLYGKSIIGNDDAITIPDQNSLVIHSPTPWFTFTDMTLYTSWACQTQTTIVTGQQPRTTSAIPNGELPDPGSPHEDLRGNVAWRFPDGDYSHFNYTTWLMMNGGEGVGGAEADLLYGLDALPSYLAGIPWVKSQYPGISSCQYLIGEGEPTVHVPVNQLTATAHSTLTLAGGPVSSTTTPTTIADHTTPSPTTTSSTYVSSKPSVTTPSVTVTSKIPDSSPSAGNPGDVHPSTSIDTSANSSPSTKNVDSLTIVSPTHDSSPPPGNSQSSVTITTQPVNNDQPSSDNPQQTQHNNNQGVSTSSPGIGQIIASIIGVQQTSNSVESHASPSNQYTPVIVANSATTATISAGSATTINGEAVSVGSSGVVVFGTGSSARTVTQGQSPPATEASSALQTSGGTITLGSGTVSFAKTDSAVIVGGSTVQIGSAIVVSGQTLSVNSKTEVVPVSSSSATQTQTSAASSTRDVPLSSVSAAGSSSSHKPSNSAAQVQAGLGAQMVMAAMMCIAAL